MGILEVDDIEARNPDGSAEDPGSDGFKHTPEPLIRSWYAAQQVLAETEPGDVVVAPDHGGIGGVLAVSEASKPRDQRRRIWTIAGDGAWLEAMLVAGTADHAEMPLASEIDWELAQYRNSEVVLAASPIAAQLLSSIGVSAEIVDVAAAPASSSDEPGLGAWAPGPVSRSNRSGDVLRAAATVADLQVTVSGQDAADLIWSGTTWEALSGVRAILGDRLRRSDRPIARPAFVVLGNALEPPDQAAAQWRDAGVEVLAPRGSVAAAMWSDVRTWDSSDELASLLSGTGPQSTSVASTPIRSPQAPSSDQSRARRVSVGVPVFRNVSFLDECVESILGQSQAPHEVLLMDDGSDSAGVDQAFRRWVDREPTRIRRLSQANRGVCTARNRMIEAMTGDAFLLVDQDDVLEPNCIKRTAEALREDVSLWAVAGWTEFFGEYQGIEAKPPFDRRVGLRENPIVSTAALVDMHVRDAGVAFAPDLAFLYCEDWHYWSQIIAAGGNIGLVPEVVVRHRVHLASGGFQRTELAHRIGRARAIEPLLDPANG